jgi:hypothetical protein
MFFENFYRAAEVLASRIECWTLALAPTLSPEERESDCGLSANLKLKTATSAFWYSQC